MGCDAGALAPSALPSALPSPLSTCSSFATLQTISSLAMFHLSATVHVRPLSSRQASLLPASFSAPPCHHRAVCSAAAGSKGFGSPSKKASPDGNSAGGAKIKDTGSTERVGPAKRPSAGRCFFSALDPAAAPTGEGAAPAGRGDLEITCDMTMRAFMMFLARSDGAPLSTAGREGCRVNCEGPGSRQRPQRAPRRSQRSVKRQT